MRIARPVPPAEPVPGAADATDNSEDGPKGARGVRAGTRCAALFEAGRACGGAAARPELEAVAGTRAAGGAGKEEEAWGTVAGGV